MNNENMENMEMSRGKALRGYRDGMVDIVGHSADPQKVIVRPRQISIFEVIIIRPEGVPAKAVPPPA